MGFRFPRLAQTASVALMLLALPAVAQDFPAPTASTAASTPATALQNELPSTSDLDWRSKGDASARRSARERDVEMWSLALIGPAAMLFVVVALGITITVRSLREDFRRQRSLNRYWRSGAMSRASESNRD